MPVGCLLAAADKTRVFTSAQERKNMSHKLIPGYEKANSHNIPIIDIVMMGNYIAQDSRFISPEIRNVKATVNGSESYGESAIGYVQVKRENNLISLIAAVAPQQHVTSASYKVEVRVDVKKGEIVSVTCFGCVAGQGGCKHGLATLGWIHRRSEEPSPTEVICYWKKSELSRVGSTIKSIEASQIIPNKKRKEEKLLRKETPSGSFFKEVMEQISMQVNKEDVTRIPEIYRHYMTEREWWACIDLHALSLTFVTKTGSRNAEKFLRFCEGSMTETACKKATATTESQTDEKLWHKLRYCRITASIIHQVAGCKTADGTLVNILFGAKVRETSAMARGKLLESQVLEEVEKQTKSSFSRCGLILHPSLPVFGASPDAINDDMVVEIKCPSTRKTEKSYLKANGQLTEKCKAQIQLQMHMAKKSSGLFCVASSSFEKTKLVTIKNVPYEKEYVDDLLERSLLFWKQNVAPKLLS